jgi:hypothetical protein
LEPGNYLISVNRATALAVTRVMFLARFWPERKQAKIFVAFLLCIHQNHKMRFICCENKKDHED